MAVEQRTESERILAAREQYVPRGIATPPIVVARAEGARVEDVDGKTYIDFAGGLGCQNTGHGFPPAVAAMHEQIDTLPPPVLHGRGVRAVRRGLPPARRAVAVRGREPEEPAPELGRRGGRERGQDRARRDRTPGVIVFENAFHGRTLLTMTMTHKEIYKQGFGPFAPEVHRAPGPYPYRGVSSDDSLDAVDRADRRGTRSPASSSSRSRARAASSTCPTTSRGGSPSCAESTASSTWTTRCNRGSVGRGRSGRSSTTRPSRTCSCPASRSAAGCRWPRSPDGPR